MRAPRYFAANRTPTALPMASDQFAFECCGQIRDLIDRPLLPTHAESHCTHDFHGQASLRSCQLEVPNESLRSLIAPPPSIADRPTVVGAFKH